MFYRPGGGLSAYRRLVAVADAWLVRRVEEFDLSQAVGVGGLTAAAGIAIRSASCQQSRVAALVVAAPSKTHAHANSARTWLRSLVAALL